MKNYHLGVIEAKFADIIWDKAPLSSSEIVKLAEIQFNWKRTTTHPVLKRLCDKGLFRNENGTVYVVLEKDDFYANQSEQYVDESFNGSLPAFISAFTKNRPVTDQEVTSILDLIDKAMNYEDK